MPWAALLPSRARLSQGVNLERPQARVNVSVFPALRPLDELKYSPIICVSASKQVGEGLERRLHGFSYVQGSGDDHELWGMVSAAS